MGMAAQVEHGSRQLARDNSAWIRGAARAGYAARGVLYVTIGVLALLLALGRGREEADKSGALREIGDKPLGRTLLVILAVAFAAFTVWQLVEATLNFEGHGPWGRVTRAFRAFIYASATWAIARYTVRSFLESGDQQSKDVTARILEWPMGPWLVGALGALLIGIGANSGLHATGDRFKKRLKHWQLAPGTERAIGIVARVGLVARMVVFSLVGLFVVRAAVTHRAGAATGLDGALRRVALVPYGRVLLVVLAVGLIAFGCYCFVEARYRRVMNR